MKWLNYHHLLYFRTIATSGGLSEAAKVLRLGQPALSTQLKKLEESFGEPLFERRNRKLILTDAGQVALRYANEIFELGQELVEVMETKRFTRTGRLRFGVLNAVPKILVQSLIEAAWKVARCRVTVLEGTGESLMRALHASSIDLMLSDYPAPAAETRSTYSRSLIQVPVAVFGSKKWIKNKGNFPACLNGVPFVGPTHHSKLRHDLDHYFQVNNIQVEMVAEAQDTDVQKLLVSQGAALTAAPEFLMRDLLKTRSVVKLGELKGVHQEFFLISSRRLITNPIATEIIEKFGFTNL